MSIRDLTVSLLNGTAPHPVGVLCNDGSSFAYLEEYLGEPGAIPLSQSLPLRREPYGLEELRPYFEGLLAEGAAREALVAELGLPADNWVALLEACGRDCIGDVMIGETELPVDGACAYRPISGDELKALFLSSGYAKENAASRLSLAGTQSKTGLAHNPLAPMGEGWSRPSGLGATTHILKSSHLRDIPEIEFLCMSSARECGISAARTGLLRCGNPVLWVERFDRDVTADGEEFAVRRIHQEDLAQAFGVIPAAKYTELEGGSVRAIARLIKSACSRPARDLASFARMLVFAYLIGDCDAHLKNYSLLYRSGETSLAPAYDLVCTTRYPRFSRDLAMDMGGAQAIDDVGAENLSRLALDLGLTVAALRRLARPLAGGLVPAIKGAAAGGYGSVLSSTPYVADDLIEDITPRLAVVEGFCRG